MKIGFIGLGSLGTPIAMNLVSRGHDTVVYNRTKAKTKPFADKSVEVADSIKDLAQACHIVFSIVSDDAALKSICEGDSGLVENLKAGALHISMSTILPALAEILAKMHAERGQQYLASPIFGRPDAADARKLNVAISGPEEARRKAEPLLKDAGALNVWDYGEKTPDANTVKLCGNYLIAAAMRAMGESIGLAQKSGVNAGQMWDMFTKTLFNSPVYVNYGKLIMEQKFEPAAFTTKLGLKDMNLVLEQAGTVSKKMALAELLQKSMTTLVNQGKGGMDWSAVSTVE